MSRRLRRSLVDGLGALSVFACLAVPRDLLAQQTAAQLTIVSAAPDPGGQTITIVGTNFGRRPLVTLELIPLTVQNVLDSQILAAAPVAAMSPGTYLLSVSRGPSPLENASVPLIVGSAATSDRSAIAGVPAVAIPPAADRAAIVGDRTLTVADVDAEWLRSDPAGFIATSRGIYENRRRILDKMLGDELIAREAAARGMSSETLLAEELPRRMTPLPDSAALSVYQNLGDLTRGATLEQMLPALRAWLHRNTEPELARMNYVEELMKTSTRAEVILAAPRVVVATTPADVALGPAAAPVVLVVFADLESLPYARLAQSFTRVRDTFGEAVRFVFKPLPLLSPQSRVDAQAAACANVQGKFWVFHDALVAQTGRFDEKLLKEVAAGAGLNRAAFDVCLAGDTFKAALDDSIADAARYGIRESPALLVNGALAPSPPVFLPPFDYLKRLIEEELQRLPRARPPR